MHAMNQAPTPRLSRVKEGYTTGARSLASRSVTSLARTRVTPNALTAAGVTLCLAAAVLVPFEAATSSSSTGSARRSSSSARCSTSSTVRSRAPAGSRRVFGAFFDSTTDRVGEGAMLAAIGLVFARAGNDVAVVFTIAAVAGSFLVPYVRAKAEALGLRGDVGLGSRAERVVVITAGLVLAPWGGLQWAIYLLAATSWVTVRTAHPARPQATRFMEELNVDD